MPWHGASGRRRAVKALIILGLTVVIFGTAAYCTWALFLKRQQAMIEEKQQPPPPPPPDPDAARISRNARRCRRAASLLEVRERVARFRGALSAIDEDRGSEGAARAAQ